MNKTSVSSTMTAAERNTAILRDIAKAKTIMFGMVSKENDFEFTSLPDDQAKKINDLAKSISQVQLGDIKFGFIPVITPAISSSHLFASSATFP